MVSRKELRLSDTNTKMMDAAVTPAYFFNNAELLKADPCRI
ncbi:7,8 dihydropteroate synthase (methanopterin) [Methanosarcina lacustris Z-7289]|uniref:7,8 dihydropteroate synthase (Methanopterin) n=1 Tax=Methanosarcina lacustris Z-7289 TaxID=1434111 RepID=A0A0E3S311_9EURY|nr:7,8 dihydropteroate synthase (methanopterin) [Methanosarcina lacustris Z-7289]